MSRKRDEFLNPVKVILAYRAGYRCCRPSCRALTVGPGQSGLESKISIGVAAHITAASPGGPRFDGSISQEERKSVTNGIWLCQTHAKEIDSDEKGFPAKELRSWKKHCEEDARSLLGRSLSNLPLIAVLEVSVQRADDDSLVLFGSTNVPDGTKLMLTLYNSGKNTTLGQAKTVVNDGTFFSSGFTNKGTPHTHGWYDLEIISHFNGPWQQPSSVMEVLGAGGEFLEGPHTEFLDPELPDSEKRLRGIFEIIAPPLKGSKKLEKHDISSAIEIVKNVVLTVDGRKSAKKIGGVVEWFFSVAGIEPRNGWSSHPRPNGTVIVEFDFFNGPEPAVAKWQVILNTREVRYCNLMGKTMSYISAYR